MKDTSLDSPRPPGKSSPALLLLLLFPLVGLVAALVMMLANSSAAQVIPTPAPVTLPPVAAQPRLNNQPAPDFELRALDQTMVKLSDYRGRVVFLNFWATWCEPCKRELPAFQAFAGAQGEDGAAVLAVNLGETYDQVNTFLSQLGVNGFRVLLDVRYEAADLYGIGPIPVTFVIDAQGIIRFAKYGEMKPEDLAGYMDALQPESPAA